MSSATSSKALTFTHSASFLSRTTTVRVTYLFPICVCRSTGRLPRLDGKVPDLFQAVAQFAGVLTLAQKISQPIPLCLCFSEQIVFAQCHRVAEPVDHIR